MTSVERPILFSAPMVRAILKGRKTQTRRPVKPQEYLYEEMGRLLWAGNPYGPIYAEWGCPNGGVSDHLWVRETWASNHIGWGFAPTSDLTRIINKIPDLPDFTVYRADGEWKEQFEQIEGSLPPWRPSIHMPRWASRITLEITNVRAERLREISRADVIAEGMEPFGTEKPDSEGMKIYRSAEENFTNIWNSIYGGNLNHGGGPLAWAQNPWVWVIEFKRVK